MKAWGCWAADPEEPKIWSPHSNPNEGANWPRANWVYDYPERHSPGAPNRQVKPNLCIQPCGIYMDNWIVVCGSVQVGVAASKPDRVHLQPAAQRRAVVPRPGG